MAWQWAEKPGKRMPASRIIALEITGGLAGL
jgi:hypothetical protein